MSYSRLCLKRGPGQSLSIRSPQADEIVVQFEANGRLRIVAPLCYRILRGELATGTSDLPLPPQEQGGRGGALCIKRNPGESVVIRCVDGEVLTLEICELGKVRIVAPRSYRILRSELLCGTSPPETALAG